MDDDDSSDLLFYAQRLTLVQRDDGTSYASDDVIGECSGCGSVLVLEAEAPPFLRALFFVKLCVVQ
jgi:hypothetical protein